MSKSMLLPLVLAAGCVGHADVMIPHPLTGHALAPAGAEVEKSQGLIETQNGLPIGTLTEKARLTKLDETRACFAVEMHSLNAEFAQLRGLDTVLKAQPSGEKVETATVTNMRTSTRVYEGLVPHQEPSGSEEYCAKRDASTNACDVWRTRTLYVTTMVPGPVTVYAGAANLCFEHAGVVTKQSQRIILDLHKITMVGFMPSRTGIDFRWGFSGYATDKGDKEKKADHAETSTSTSTASNDEDTDAKLEAAMAEKEKERAAVESKKRSRHSRVARHARPAET